MSKEQDFHKKIMQSNAEEKENLWSKIESQNISSEAPVGEVLVKSKFRQKMLIAIPFLLLLVGGLIFLICKLTIKNDLSNFRYCTYDDYYISDTDATIKQYSADADKELLYFDWYDTTEYYYDKQFKLKTTNEVICLHEDIVDENGAYISLYITDNYTEIDTLKLIYDNCVNALNINSREIKWGGSKTADMAYVFFSYEKNNYYLTVQGYNDQDYIENLLSVLLN